MNIDVSSEYFKSHRRTVECRIQFLKLGEIHVTQEMFRATVVIKSKWTEHGMLIDKYDPEVHWNPELFVENWKRIPASTNVVNISYTVQHKNDSTVVIETREIQGRSQRKFIGIFLSSLLNQSLLKETFGKDWSFTSSR